MGNAAGIAPPMATTTMGMGNPSMGPGSKFAMMGANQNYMRPVGNIPGGPRMGVNLPPATQNAPGVVSTPMYQPPASVVAQNQPMMNQAAMAARLRANQGRY